MGPEEKGDSLIEIDDHTPTSDTTKAIIRDMAEQSTPAFPYANRDFSFGVFVFS